MTITIGTEAPIVIGTEGEVSANAPQLAGKHCRIRHDGSGHVVEHLDGVRTRINGTPIDVPTALHDGDEIACGGLKIRFTQLGKKTRTVPGTATRPLPPSPPPPPPPPTTPEAKATVERLEREVAVLRQQLDGSGIDRAAHEAELGRLGALLDSIGEENARLRGRLEQRDADLHRAEVDQMKARSLLDDLRRELESCGQECATRDQQIVELTARVAGLNQDLDNAESNLRKELARGDDLHRDKDRIETRAAQLYQENLEIRREHDQTRLLLESAKARVEEAQLERDRSQSNLAKLSNRFAELQHRLDDVMVRDGTLTGELEELRALVEAQQDELRVISQARQRVQGLYDDLQKRHHSMDVSAELLKGENSKLANENARHRVELERLRAELERVVRDRVSDATTRDAMLALESLRGELAVAQTTIIQLRTDNETYRGLRDLLAVQERP